jgi:hypothetical protein
MRPDLKWKDRRQMLGSCKVSDRHGGTRELSLAGGVDHGLDEYLDVAVVESGDGVTEDDRGVAGQAGGKL